MEYKNPHLVKTGTISAKLLELKFRMLGWPYSSTEVYEDMQWVTDRVIDIRENVSITKGMLLHANNLWKKYRES